MEMEMRSRQVEGVPERMHGDRLGCWRCAECTESEGTDRPKSKLRHCLLLRSMMERMNW